MDRCAQRRLHPRWRGGQQLRITDIRSYVSELTPLVLLVDTRVTNHGFRKGRPTPHQSVLQAGTAVLVDRVGVPVPAVRAVTRSFPRRP